MTRLDIDFLTEYDASLLAELRRVATATGSDTVTKADLKRIGRVSHSAVVRHFGSLRHALHLAGLKSTRFMKATDEELIAIIIDLWQQVLKKEGCTPQQKDLKEYGFPVSNDTTNRRFGSWRKALVKAQASITEKSISEQQSAPAENAPRKREPLSIRKRFFVLKRDHLPACVAEPAGWVFASKFIIGSSSQRAEATAWSTSKHFAMTATAGNGIVWSKPKKVPGTID